MRGVRLEGRYVVVARDATGRIIGEVCASNLIVNTGITWLAGALSGATATPSGRRPR